MVTVCPLWVCKKEMTMSTTFNRDQREKADIRVCV